MYGIDVEDSELMRSRSWPWLRLRILGLLSTSCRLTQALAVKMLPKEATS